MPNFSNRPPDDADRPGIRLVRTPSGHPLVAIVSSEDLVGTATHFHHNRTMPCEGPGCKLCAEGHSWRWHGYFSCVDQSTREHILFEFTAQASDAFRDYREKYSTLRGCLFKATRAGNRYNARVMIQTKPADLAQTYLPPGVDLPKVLCHIWNIPTPEATVTDRIKGHPRVKVRRSKTGNGQPTTATATK